MNRFTGPLLAALLAVSAPAAMAGGPVIVEDSLEEVAKEPAGSVGVLPVILIAVALCAALCGNGGEPEKVTCKAAQAC